MSSYRFEKQGTATRSDKSRIKTSVTVLFVTLVLLVPVAIYVVYTTLPPNPVTGKTVDKGYFDPFTTVETDWFSFRIEKTWVTVDDLTIKDKRYVYREMQGANPQGLLTIFVNSRPVGAEDFYTRVLPVTISEKTSLLPMVLQPNCNTLKDQAGTSNHTVSQEGASFVCWAGGTTLYAVASEVNGDDTLTMQRRDGSTANYVITYRNLAFTENETTFQTVMKTFKSR